ncbi:MAG TPA: YqaE/Pmp3 family membrane protein [Phnomibacter sp.]|nr:YqaE/Pmp3 family membrane protein [Phnomibacter sp.]
MASRITLLLACIFMLASVSNAAFVSTLSSTSSQASQENNAGFKSFSDLNSFLSLTPKSYKELTGKKLSLKEKLSLKITQKMMKKQSQKAASGGTLPQWAYIVLSIICLGWLAIGIKSNWSGNDWWIDLLLYFLFILPGIIYALVVMNKYY